MYQIGDVIDIQITLPQISYSGKMVISYLGDGLLITCGHCLPKNTNLDFGKIIYTSGFDNPEEGRELGLIKIYPSHQKKFNPYLNGKKVNLSVNLISNNSDIILLNKGQSRPGKILTLIKKGSNNSKGIINVMGWQIDHQIDKLWKPYYLAHGANYRDHMALNNSLVKWAKEVFQIDPTKYNKIKTFSISKQNYSGSPWLKIQDGTYTLIGIHIGKTIGINIQGNTLTISEIAYIRPI